jgi:hypothetical protein
VIHKVKWDLVVFDEYTLAAGRETAKGTLRGRGGAVAKKGGEARYGTWAGNMSTKTKRTHGEED